MKTIKESYRRKMPHFQQPGQCYSLTCVLKGAMPKKAMEKYSLQLASAKQKWEWWRKEAGQEFEEPGVQLFKLNSCNLKSCSPGDSYNLKSCSPGDSCNLQSCSPGQQLQVKNLQSLEKAKRDYYIALRKYRWLTTKYCTKRLITLFH